MSKVMVENKCHEDPAHQDPRNFQESTCVGCAICIRRVWADYLCIAIFAVLTLGIWAAPTYYFENRVVPMWPSAPERFPDSAPTFRPPAELEYPWRREPVPSWCCGLIVICLPLLVVTVFQLRNRSLWDFHAGVAGVFKAVVATTFVCTILKQFIGGFRPYFMEVCQPDIDSMFKLVDHDIYWFNATACTGASYDIKKAMQSFPSGHTANAFAAGMFTSLYINGKLKLFGEHSTNFGALMITIAPLLGASLIAGSMYISHQHHGDDIAFGIVIGVSLGILAYRSGYAAVFDFHYNHIPLPPFTNHAHLPYNKTVHPTLPDAPAETPPTKKSDLVGCSLVKQFNGRNSTS